ncbi:MAG: excinuclease ABC subunit UvrC [Proteobacteria bacterium]|nr:excinuclease ABC subunit UvrC [Pseudomonadota bacterium]
MAKDEVCVREQLSPFLREKLRGLPKEPGCYLMKNSGGRVIYVGKAKVLRSRVAHYFVPPQQLDRKTHALANEIADFEVLITATDLEALLLERTLIKHHKPHYNILLRDDKEYPYLRANFNEPWPRLERVRKRRDDGAKYLGPFGSPGQLKILMAAAMKIFPLIRCSRFEFANARRPCNYYHMKLCLGPCTLPVDAEVYRAMVQSAMDFIAGKNLEVLRHIKAQMAAAAAAEDYERAALYRDQIKAFAQVTEKQTVVTHDVADADVFGLSANAVKSSFHVLMIRDSRLIGGESYVLRSPVDTEQEAMTEFLLQYYDGRSLPAEVIVPHALDDVDTVRTALLSGHPEVNKLILQAPQRGTRVDLVAMAQKNAEYRLSEIDKQAEKQIIELQILQERLKLRRLPQRMECIDISNIQGTAIVASDVCFVGGKPAKELYRHYVITEVVGAPDDFASIREVVRRRLERGIRDQDLPDLLIIDGGKGQLSAAEGVLATFPALDMELISLAKSRADQSERRRSFIARGEQERSFERVFFPDRAAPLPLSPGTPEYRLMTQIRDEAHRFAITHHRKRRGKLSHQSDLEAIPGIGPTLRRVLLETFGGLDGLNRATLAELKAIKGLRESSAVALFSHLRGKEE